MRFAVINDVQGNAVALNAVLEDIAGHEGVERIVSTGDLVGRGPQPNEVIDTIRDRRIESVLGNYDDAVAYERFASGTDFGDEAGERTDATAVDWTRSVLTAENLEYLVNLPREMRLHPEYRGIGVERVRDDEQTRQYRRTFFMRALFGGLVRENRRPMTRMLRVALVHGSPRALNEFVRADTAQSLLQAMSKDAGTDVLITGHAGDSFQRELERVTFIGAGSVSGVPERGPIARYVIVDVTDAVETEFHAVEYDPGPLVDAIRGSGLPDAFADAFGP